MRRDAFLKGFFLAGILLYGFHIWQNQATEREHPPSGGVPPSVVAYLGSLKQNEDSVVVQLFERLVQEGLGEVLAYHLFLDTTLRHWADLLLSPELRDSLQRFL